MLKIKNSKTVLVGLLLLAICAATGQQVFSYPDGRPFLRGAASTNVKLAGESIFEGDSQPVTVSLRDSDVKQALRMFADKAGMNVIFHDSVKGKITLDLVDVPLGDAVRMIAQMAELTYVVDANTLMFISNEEAQKLDITKNQMSVIPLKYVDAASAAEFLNGNIFRKARPGLSNSNVATANPAKNELILFGQEEDFKVVQKVLSKIDVKPHVSTYKVNHTTPKEMANMICQSLFGVDSSAQEPAAASWTDKLEIGGAYKACRVESKVANKTMDAESANDGKLINLPGNSMSIFYIPANGNVQVVGGSPEQIQFISDFIAHNDRKQPQAYIEVSIVELSESGSKDFQNTWNIYSNFFTGSIGGNGISTASNYPIFWKSVNNLVPQPDAYSFVSGYGYNDDGSININDPSTTPIVFNEGKNTVTSYSNYVRGLVLEDPTSVKNYLAEKSNYLTAWSTYEADVKTYAYQYNNYLKALANYQAGYTNVAPTAPTKPTAPTWTAPAITTTNAAYRYTQKSAITQQLNYVVQNGKGRMVANPKIIVTNGKKATINLTNQYVSSVDSQVLQSESYIGGGTQRTYNIGNDNGIKIELVPFISPDGYVSMSLKPSYKAVAEQIYAPNNMGVSELQATLLRDRSFELSNVRVKDGETLVLGGFVQDYEAKSVSKTPILGDLPIIGFLFRNSSTSNQKTEMVLLITPRIIKDSEDVIGAGSSDL